VLLPKRLRKAAHVAQPPQPRDPAAPTSRQRTASLSSLDSMAVEFTESIASVLFGSVGGGSSAPSPVPTRSVASVGVTLPTPAARPSSSSPPLSPSRSSSASRQPRRLPAVVAPGAGTRGGVGAGSDGPDTLVGASVLLKKRRPKRNR
jgi:hypothetical protein